MCSKSSLTIATIYHKRARGGLYARGKAYAASQLFAGK
jgi:hypothetical protein